MGINKPGTNLAMLLNHYTTSLQTLHCVSTRVVPCIYAPCRNEYYLVNVLQFQIMDK
jgi:hypothetical protein